MKNTLIYILVVTISSYVGYVYGQGNQVARYAQSGYPANCRALIQDNISGVAVKKYTSEEALYSIERNCGSNGLIWNVR